MTVVVSEVDDTERSVTGLTPSVLYTFSVTAENDVSSQDNNINVRTVTTTATTEEGGIYYLHCKFRCVIIVILAHIKCVVVPANNTFQCKCAICWDNYTLYVC